MSGIYSNYYYTNYGDVQTYSDWPYRTPYTDKGPSDNPINVGLSDNPKDSVFPTFDIPYNTINIQGIYKTNPEQLKEYETMFCCLSKEIRDRYLSFIDGQKGKQWFRVGPYMEYMYSLFRTESLDLQENVFTPQQLFKLVFDYEKIYVIDNMEDLINCSFTVISDVNGRTCTYQKHYIGLDSSKNKTNKYNTVTWASKSILEHEFKQNRLYKVFYNEIDCINFLRKHSFGYWDILGFRVNLPSIIGN